MSCSVASTLTRPGSAGRGKSRPFAQGASAEGAIDAQYYIWHGDPVGCLMFQALWQAAQRGVRVRLLPTTSTRPG
jgi:hypothetical protein